MQKRWALIALLSLAAGCCHHHDKMGKSMEKEEDEKNEVKMSINDVPAPVREGLMKAAGGATIKTVDKEERGGKLVYETDVMSGGKNWEIVVDANGNLVSKGIDNEEAEKSEAKPKKSAAKDDDDDEKDEKKNK
jgi:hypothetical protein